MAQCEEEILPAAEKLGYFAVPVGNINHKHSKPIQLAEIRLSSVRLQFAIQISGTATQFWNVNHQLLINLYSTAAVTNDVFVFKFLAIGVNMF